MSTSAFPQWTKSTKLGFEPFIELNSISTRICTEIAREHLKLMNEIMQCNTEFMHAISHAKGAEEVMNANARWTSKVTPQICECTQHILDAFLEGANEYNRWIEKEFHHVAKEAQSAQEKFTKGARHLHDKFSPPKNRP